MTAATLYSFGSTATDAMTPGGIIIQGSDGNFYGVTFRGGLPDCDNGSANTSSANIGCGTVYKVTPAGEETVLHLFSGAPADGAFPENVIQGSDGNFYGTTLEGGANNNGTVFRLTPEGVETILYSFTGASDGGGGMGLVQARDGSFYGTTTSGGGANSGGTVFKMTSEGVETVLYSFAGTNYAGPDGASPTGQLVQGSDGNFYGVTELGGLPSPVVMWTTTCGTVFKVTPEGTETILYRFSGPDGMGPNGLIQGTDGNLYGTAGSTTSLGVAFSVTPEGVETTLYSFCGTGSACDAAFPGALTEGSDGNFYGTTSGGGKNQGGTMFQLTPAGVETVLYYFPTFPNTTFPDPSPSTNLVQGSDGNFYGATFYGGAYDEGYFFKLILSSN